MDFKAVQEKWQKKWEEEKVFEVNPNKKEKFFMTTPYPYISGSLHIGHARVVTEADVFVRYQKMLGKNVLFPIAFHISGTPVLGISLAIKNKDEDKIELYKGYVRKYVSDEKKVEEIVKSFEDPWKIVEFFIPKMRDEFKTLGLAVDWRRSYTSGDIEHQALVEWQFRKYKEKNYLIQGKYPILFSKTLKNAVGEDDIQDGDIDPVEIQEFTLIKFKYGDCFLVAATLRPETMYGQTNMWVNPEVEYSIAKVEGEKWIISKECIEKLKFQDKKVEIIGKINGMELIGKKCFAPFIERGIIILPSLHCNPDIGTGIVTSVPSDAPFDYIALKELQDSKEICKKYNLDYEEVKDIRIIPIITSKDYGELPAVEICKKRGIKNLSQLEKLTEATQEIYKVGFHTGIMNQNCGIYKGLPVVKAKEDMKNQLLKEKKADKLYEVSRIAKSRDGGEVVVAVLDGQWFLDFNAKGWKNQAKKSLKKVELWPEKYRKQFEDVFEWLDKRPCARMRGLGTNLPFEKQWIIESLSDSTIYMALYPIIHIIRENNIKKEQLNTEFFEYVMNSKGKVEAVAKLCKINKSALEKMNKEWNYWYPFDQRHTFTAHLSNHLSFMLFAHTAVFSEEHWPKRISFHGMIISEGEKMSKSKGNVITLMDINERFGADAFRAFMCNSTSVESTFNWQTDKVEVMKKHLEGLYEVILGIQRNKKKGKIEEYKSFISKTENSIRKAKGALEKMDLREYSNIVLYQMLSNYKKVLKTAKQKEIPLLNNYVANNWIIMLMPLVPHMAEELWSVNKNEGLVFDQSWPEYDSKKIDEKAEFLEEQIDSLIEDVNQVQKLAKIEKMESVKFIVAAEWKYSFMKKFKEKIEETRDIGVLIKGLIDKEHAKEISSLVPVLLKNSSKIPLMVLTQKEEVEVLKEYKKMFEERFSCKVEIEVAGKSFEVKAGNAMPGRPAVVVESIYIEVLIYLFYGRQVCTGFVE